MRGRAAAYRSGRRSPPQRARRTAAGPAAWRAARTGPARRADHTAPRAQRTAARAVVVLTAVIRHSDDAETAEILAYVDLGFAYLFVLEVSLRALGSPEPSSPRLGTSSTRWSSCRMRSSPR